MKKISYFVYTGIIISCIIPAVVFAQGYQDVKTGLDSFQRIIDTLTGGIVKSLATLFMSLALLAFFYGIVQYIWGKRKGDTNATKIGNDFMTWGLVALFVMFSVYGIIKLGQSILFNNSDVSTIKIPSFDFKQGNSSNVQIGNQSPSSPGFQPSTSQSNPGFQPSSNNGGVLSRPSASNPTADPCIDFVDGHVCSNGQGVCNQGVCVVDTRGTATPSNNSAPSLNGCTQANIGSSCTKTTGGTGTCQASDTEYFCQ